MNENTEKKFHSPAFRAGMHGVIFGLIAAICYGFIPLFALPICLSENPADRMSTPSLLFYRFLFATIVVGAYMLVTRKSFRVTRPEMVTLAYLAFLSDGSALFLNEGYNYLSSGVATTIHFMYPVVTAVMMMAFYNESRKFSTIAAVGMAVIGVGVLSWQPDGSAPNWHGVVIEMISACCYALYIIRVNRSRVRDMDGLKLTFYVMGIGAAIFAAEAIRQDDFQTISTATQAGNLAMLVLVCTVVTNLCLVAAVKRIGSTMTAVIGALEPLTAVTIGSIVFDEAVTWNVLAGIGLIIPAVLIVIFTRGR